MVVRIYDIFYLCNLLSGTGCDGCHHYCRIEVPNHLHQTQVKRFICESVKRGEFNNSEQLF